MAAAGKQVRQEELRRLMREKQRQNAGRKRVDSPFAKYPRHRLPGAPLRGGPARWEGGREGGGPRPGQRWAFLNGGRHVQQPGAPGVRAVQRAREERAAVADTRPGQAAPRGERPRPGGGGGGAVLGRCRRSEVAGLRVRGGRGREGRAPRVGGAGGAAALGGVR